MYCVKTTQCLCVVWKHLIGSFNWAFVSLVFWCTRWGEGGGIYHLNVTTRQTIQQYNDHTAAFLALQDGDIGYIELLQNYANMNWANQPFISTHFLKNVEDGPSCRYVITHLGKDFNESWLCCYHSERCSFCHWFRLLIIFIIHWRIQMKELLQGV